MIYDLIFLFHIILTTRRSAIIENVVCNKPLPHFWGRLYAVRARVRVGAVNGVNEILG